MHWSPFFEIFIGLFLALGISIGWFTRIAVWKIGIVVTLVVFVGLTILSAFDPPANPGISQDDLWVSAFLAVFAGIPAFAAAALGRQIKKWRSE